MTRQIAILIVSIVVCFNCLSIDVHQKANVYYDSWVPRLISQCCRPINGITLGHSIFIYRDRWTADSSFVLEHELMHIKQEEQYSVLGFYIVYLVGTLWYGYMDHPFEIEARTEAINVDLSNFTYTIYD